MGLVVQSLDMLSPDAKREYYIYLLDYGWDEPLSEVIRQNFFKIAGLACKTESAFIAGDGNLGHFDDEVLSWHSINGDDAERVLPALLITKTNPHEFRNRPKIGYPESDSERFKFILIPLKRVCNNATEVMQLITSLFKDIQNKKDLNQFVIQRELKPGIKKALVNSLILEPNIYGLGLSFKRLKEFLG